MAGVMLGAAYAAAGVIGWASRKWYARTLEPGFEKFENTMLGVLGVLTALLVTFLANNVWNDVTEAGQVVREEARALEQAARVAERLPQLKAPLHALIQQYAAALIEREWPAMARDEADDQAGRLLSEAERLALALAPDSDNERELHNRLMRHLEGAIDARLKRLEISRRKVAALRIGVLAAGVITLIAIAIVHVRAPREQLIALALYATSIAVILLQILAYDRPFIGSVIVGPEPFIGLMRL
jgi:Protein of unknown function (DUF4239)